MGVMTNEEFYNLKPATPRGLARFLRSKGYDGLVYKNFAETSSPEIEMLMSRYKQNPHYETWQEMSDLRNQIGQDSYVAFDPKQITVINS